MNYAKIETPENFRFASEGEGEGKREGGFRIGGELLTPRLEERGADIWRYSLPAPRWPEGTASLAALGSLPLYQGGSLARAEIGEGGAPRVLLDGIELLVPSPGRGFGLCGRKWILTFRFDEDALFYGMGEKNFGIEVSGKRSLFWNTDLFADFEWSAVERAEADPLYISLPVLILRRAGAWLGLIVETAEAPFMNTGAVEPIFSVGGHDFKRELSLGARGGEPALWLAVARDPATLVRKLQAIQGRMSLPPLWALGHHQCRWGYRSFGQLESIAREYERRGIPNDGLWLDIDAMEGYRVFTCDPERFPDPEGKSADFASRGFKLVPILDPGIRRDPDFPVYRRAREGGVLCRTPEGADYVGFVWPGYTVFPDFATEEGRAFWAREVATFTARGFAGYWIDMNDPSTGSAPVDDMLFGDGSIPHASFHNQYALGMALATRAGIEAARPEERPFLLSRSASLGSSRYTAVWTGDNVSNEAHLGAAISVSLNLSVSGLPFNGPDVPGFAGDADAALMRAWYKAGFLFPFLRNHKVAGARDQEPWTRGRRTEAVVRRLIESRYRLIPYLYNLCIDAAESGDPILRPLWYRDPSPEAARLADEFLVGPNILQAPLLKKRGDSRRAWLPPGRWFDPATGRTRRGGAFVEARQGFASTPLWFSSPSLIPLAGKASLRAGSLDLSRADFLLFIEEGEEVAALYRWDGGLRQGDEDRGILRLKARLTEGWLSVETELLKSGARALSFRILFPRGLAVRELRVDGSPRSLGDERIELAGRKLRIRASDLLSPTES